MENHQHDLCLEVLHRLDHAGVLNQVVLVGSWCLVFYRNYFSPDDLLPPIRTRDLDFLIPAPKSLKGKVDLQALLSDLGFVAGFKGSEGYLTLQHPNLILEFLVPERGKGQDVACKIPKLGINAQPLRFMDMLIDHAIQVDFHGLRLSVPHPASLAIHKLLISRRRKNEKGEKDLRQAIAILHVLIRKQEVEAIQKTMATLPVKWRRSVIKILEETGESLLASFLHKG